MIEFAQYYYFIYWFIVMLMTVNKFNVMRHWPEYIVAQRRDNYGPMLLFVAFYVLFFGLRPITGEYFGDTGNYASHYEVMHDHGVYDMSGTEEAGKDVIFRTFMFQCAQIIDVHSFFTLVMFLYVVLMFVGCRKIDHRHGATLMLFCIGAMSFYTYSVNGLRNGVACSIIILALALLSKRYRLWAVVLSFIAIGCHKSTALPVVCMFFTYFVRNPKLMYITWIGSILLSYLFGGYIENMMALMNFDERLSGILQDDTADGQVLEHRFRWDFLLYSSMPLLLGWYTIFIRKIKDKTYLLLLGTYIYANSFWVLVIRAIFSNRISYLSWFIYPIVLAYPLLNLPVFKQNHSMKTAYILLAHFGFTTCLWLLLG